MWEKQKISVGRIQILGYWFVTSAFEKQGNPPVSVFLTLSSPTTCPSIKL